MTDNEPKEWEKEFDEVFLEAVYQDDGYTEEREKLKQFIRDNFIPKSEVRKVVEGMKISASGKHDPWSIEVAHIEAPKSYNTAFSDLLRALHISEE